MSDDRTEGFQWIWKSSCVKHWKKRLVNWETKVQIRSQWRLAEEQRLWGNLLIENVEFFQASHLHRYCMFTGKVLACKWKQITVIEMTKITKLKNYVWVFIQRLDMSKRYRDRNPLMFLQFIYDILVRHSFFPRYARVQDKDWSCINSFPITSHHHVILVTVKSSPVKHQW